MRPAEPSRATWLIQAAPESGSDSRKFFDQQLSETSLLTLAHASGLMAEALGCDDSSIHMIPATGHGTYSFAFTVGHASPHTLEHRDGQLEIDSVCIGIREGRNYVIVTSGAGRPAVDSGLNPRIFGEQRSRSPSGTRKSCSSRIRTPCGCSSAGTGQGSRR